ncbi:MAG: acyl-CoA desaturase [Actinobacteria bacterium]|nr:acyl-CoA desaturase [Actinomycetota bacterium]
MAVTIAVTTGAPVAPSRPAPVSRARVGVPFVLVHLGVLALPFVGWSWAALCGAAVFYLTRMLGITVFYHRGFSHRAFKMTRPVQFAGAVLGASAAQRGPLWWSATHRAHHRFTDRPGDPHSPVVNSFVHSHVGWLFRPPAAPLARVADLARFPELRLVDRYHHIAPVLTALTAFGAGACLARLDPALHTSGPQMLVWGFFVATTLLYHATFSVNSFAHRFGSRRFATNDESRNNGLVAVLTLGEGWHNNHHRFPGSARQGLGRFELDPSWWFIRTLAALRLVGTPRAVPGRVWEQAALVDDAKPQRRGNGAHSPSEQGVV